MEQLSYNEDIIAKKSIQALQEIDVKLQKEITNFINLKMKLALAKSGVDLSFMSAKSSEAFLDGHSVLFEDLEHGLISHLEQIEKTNLNTKSKDKFLKANRSSSGSPARAFKSSFNGSSAKVKTR